MSQRSLLPPPARSDVLELDLENVGAKNYLTHNFHPYPAKFIPQIPAAILDHYAPSKSVVLDPFCGSGTVAVEAAIRGHYCIANDINPIASLITKAKTITLGQSDVLQLRRLLQDLTAPRHSDIAAEDLPAFKNRDLWFSKTMLRELAVIRKKVESLEPLSGAAVFADCAFSAIVVKCSNQESETHWRSVDKSLPMGFAITAFAQKLNDMLVRSAEYAAVRPGLVDVRTGTALSLSTIESACVDIVITSPPYANSHDYYLYNKLRMFWLGHDHYPLQTTEIGSRHRHSDLKEPIENYLAEMHTSLSEIARVLKKGGIAAIVVGDSIYKSVLIDMGKQYSRLAADIGLSKVYHFDFDQRRYTSAFQRGLKTMPKRSHILAFRKG